MILNRQRTVRVARPPLELFLRRVREKLGLEDAEVTVCLVSDAEIARMNESFRKKTGPTDVLSFPAVGRRKPVPLPNRNGHKTFREGAGFSRAETSDRTRGFSPGIHSRISRRHRHLPSHRPPQRQKIQSHPAKRTANPDSPRRPALAGLRPRNGPRPDDRLEQRLRQKLGLS